MVHIFQLGHELVLKWKEVACCFFLFEFGTYSREEVSKSFVHLDRNCIAGWTPFRFHIQLRGSIVSSGLPAKYTFRWTSRSNLSRRSSSNVGVVAGVGMNLCESPRMDFVALGMICPKVRSWKASFWGVEQ